MNYARLSLVVAAAFTLSAAAAVAADPAPVTAEAGKEYLLAHKSSYSAADDAHNPFWPIGFKPAPVSPSDNQQAPLVEAVPEVRPEAFVVTTISLERDSPLAVINGRTHAVGDKLAIDATGKQFVTVRQIVDGAVIFDFHGKTIKSVAGRRGVGK